MLASRRPNRPITRTSRAPWPRRQTIVVAGLLTLISTAYPQRLSLAAASPTVGAREWSAVEPLRLPGNAFADGEGWGPADMQTPSFSTLACSSSSHCLAVGSYTVWAGDNSPEPCDPETGGPEGCFDVANAAMIVPVINGVPGAVSPLSLGDQTNLGSSLDALVCPSASSCFAVGTDDWASQPIVVPIIDGRPSPAAQVRLPANAAGNDTGRYAALYSVACVSASYCLAVGTYTDSSDSAHDMLVPIRNGLPGPATEVRLAGAASGSGGFPIGLFEAGPPPTSDAVVCTSNELCVAVGGTSAVTVRQGVVGEARAVSFPHGSIGRGLSLITCPSETTCLALGQEDNAGALKQ